MWDTGLSHQTGYAIHHLRPLPTGMTWRYQPDRYKVSNRVTAFTSTDGGLILAPPSPPTAPRSLEAMNQCADQITPELDGAVQLRRRTLDVDRNREWSHGKIVVSEASTIERYDVEYRERGRGSWMDLSATGTEAAVTSGLEYGKTYDFRVRAMNDIGLYGPWASTTITSWKRRLGLCGRRHWSRPMVLSSDDAAQPVIILQWDAPEDSTTNPLWREESSTLKH